MVQAPDISVVQDSGYLQATGSSLVQAPGYSKVEGEGGVGGVPTTSVIFHYGNFFPPRREPLTTAFKCLQVIGQGEVMQ